MKGFIYALIVLSVPLLGLAYWLWRPRLQVMRSRMRLAMKATAVVYLAIIVARMATSDVSQEQLQVIGLSAAFFVGLWVVAWLVTRSLAKR
ncbi:MAG: hypothetical protein ACM3US_11705 [Sphingomonadaceae bacterium]